MTRQMMEKIIALKVRAEWVQLALESAQSEFFTASEHQDLQLALEKLHIEAALSGLKYSVSELHRALNVPDNATMEDYKF